MSVPWDTCSREQARSLTTLSARSGVLHRVEAGEPVEPASFFLREVNLKRDEGVHM